MYPQKATQNTSYFSIMEMCVFLYLHLNSLYPDCLVEIGLVAIEKKLFKFWKVFCKYSIYHKIRVSPFLLTRMHNAKVRLKIG